MIKLLCFCHEKNVTVYVGLIDLSHLYSRAVPVRQWLQIGSLVRIIDDGVVGRLGVFFGSSAAMWRRV